MSTKAKKSSWLELQIKKPRNWPVKNANLWKRPLRPRPPHYKTTTTSLTSPTKPKGGDGDATLSATDIKVHNLTIRAKGKILLENTTLTIAAGRRYGLVGPNGKGKSTLLRMIARRQVPVPENLDVLLVEQEVVGTEASALESVVAADVELMALREEETAINAKLGGLDIGGDTADLNTTAAAIATTNQEEGAMPDDTDALAVRLNEVYERMAEIGGASAEARASKILHGLGFTKEMQARATNLFSGGWRMRISLARALYIQPTVLLLDEPTNHLDLRAVLWLEEYLTRWKKTLIVVSHDRDFLNSVTTDIIHLHDERLHYYRGNFAQFEEMYEQRRREVNKEFEKYQKQMKAAKKSGSKANADKVDKNAKLKQKAKDKQRGGGGGGVAAVRGGVVAVTPEQGLDNGMTIPSSLNSRNLRSLPRHFCSSWMPTLSIPEETISVYEI